MIELGLLDSSFAHCEFSNNPQPITNRAKHMIWKRGSIDEGVIFITESGLGDHRWKSIPVERRVLWLLEPEGLIPHVYRFARENHRLFKNVISSNKNLGDLPNYQWIPFGGCWIDAEDRICGMKDGLINIVASEKRMLEGHRQRHQLIENLRGTNNWVVLGRGYRAIPKKIDTLRGYQFQVVIENERHPGYFTEKIIDCFMTGTIPVYLGAPDISEYFDVSQFINCESIEEVQAMVNSILRLDIKYENFDPKVNFDKGSNYMLAEDYLIENLESVWKSDTY